jgi:hypothetical protein
VGKLKLLFFRISLTRKPYRPATTWGPARVASVWLPVAPRWVDSTSGMHPQSRPVHWGKSCPFSEGREHRGCNRFNNTLFSSYIATITRDNGAATDYHSRVLWGEAVTSLPLCERTFSGWLEDREALSAGGRSAQDAARSRITRGVHHPNACPDPPRYDRGLGRDVARRNRPAAEQTTLPNVSYDPTRELYHCRGGRTVPRKARFVRAASAAVWLRWRR